MGLGDLTKNAIVNFGADASGFLRAVETMGRAEDGLHEQRRRQSKETDGFFANIEANYKNVTGIVGALKSAWSVASDAVESYGKQLDLTATAGTISLEKLSEAAGGLKTNMQLLEHAAKMNQSVFKLTQDQMIQVERAMWVLEERGHSSETVWNAFNNVISKGAVRSLEQFGIILDTSKFKVDEQGNALDKLGQRTEIVDSFFKSLSRTLGDDMKNATRDAADDFVAAEVKFKNAMDELKIGLGKVAVAFIPVIESLAETVNLAGKLANASGVAGAIKFAQRMNKFGPDKLAGYTADAVTDAQTFLSDKMDDNTYIIQGNLGNGIGIKTMTNDYNYTLSGLGYQKEFRPGEEILSSVVQRPVDYSVPFGPARRPAGPAPSYSFGKNGVDAQDLYNLLGMDPIRRQLDELDAPKEGDFFEMFGIDPIRVGMNRLDAKSAGSYSPRRLTDEDFYRAFGLDPVRLAWDESKAAAAAEARQRSRDADSAFRVSSYGGVGLGDSSLYGNGGYGAYGGFDRYSALGTDVGAAFGTLNFNEINSRGARFADSAGRRNSNSLESLFGKPSEFQLYQNLFKGLGDAIGGTYEAIVKGTEPASQAFKKLIGSMLLAVGKQEAVMAIKDGAWALGSLAFGDMIGFARYGKSALAHGAAAVAAGAAASALGVGGGATAGGGTGAGAAAPTGAGGGGGGGERGRDVVVVMTDPFAQDSARNRQNNAEKIVRKAFGGRGGQDN